MKHSAINLVKFKALGKRLGVPMYRTVGILEAVWIFAAHQARDGDLSKFSALELAGWIEWEGDENDLINALVETRWLDRDGDQLTIHDWDEHKPNWLKAAESPNRGRYKRKGGPSDGPGNGPSDGLGSGPSEGPPNETKRNQTKPNQTQGRLSSDEGDHAVVAVDDLPVRTLANEVAQKLGKSRGKGDRSLVLKSCWLAINRFGEHWLRDAIEATTRVNPKPSKPYAYFHRCLENTSREKFGVDFSRELAVVSVSDELLSMPPPKRDERLIPAGAADGDD